MKTIEANYHDLSLFPPSIEDWIPADHPARFIREVVNQIDISLLESDKGEQKTGRPSYSDRLLLRVWLMGYWRGIRSVRKLEQACKESLPFIWLCGNYPPDHTTLWRFFRDNKSYLRCFFKQTVVLAKKLDLVDFVLQAVDGTKIKAACSPYLRTNKEGLKKLLERLDNRIDSIEKTLSDSTGHKRTSDASLPKELKDHRRLRDKVKFALKELEAGSTKYCHPQDPQARRMECNEGNQFGYNAQAVVDSKSQIIVAEEVVKENTDIKCLHEMIKKAEITSGRAADLTLADKGYSTSAQLAMVAESGYNVLAPLYSNAGLNNEQPYHTSQFTYKSEKDVVICPQGKELYYCKTRNYKDYQCRYYHNLKACNECPVRNECTKSPRGRYIEIRTGHEQTMVMRRKLKEPRNQELLRRRSGIVEPVFAQIKSNGGFNRWTMHGLENARSQWALLCSVWNLRVLYALWKRKVRGFWKLFHIFHKFHPLNMNTIQL